MSGIVTTMSTAVSMRTRGRFHNYVVEAAGYNDAGEMLVRLCKASSAFRQPERKIAPKAPRAKQPRHVTSPRPVCGCGLCRNGFEWQDRPARTNAKRAAIEEELYHARELADLQAVSEDEWDLWYEDSVGRDALDYEDWLDDEMFARLDEREEFLDRLEDIIYAPVSQVATEEIEDLMGARVERDGAVLIGRGSSWAHV